VTTYNIFQNKDTSFTLQIAHPLLIYWQIVNIKSVLAKSSSIRPRYFVKSGKNHLKKPLLNKYSSYSAMTASVLTDQQNYTTRLSYNLPPLPISKPEPCPKLIKHMDKTSV